MIPHCFKDKHIVVLGLGRSGTSTATALQKAGAHVYAWDDQEGARASAKAEGVAICAPDDMPWDQIDEMILSPGIPHLHPAPHPVVARAQSAGIHPINDIELLYRQCPEATFVGITGTNGKSTTTALVGHILQSAGRKVQVGGNIGIPVMNLEALGAGGIYVLEMSSYQLETAPSLHFKACVILNITPDHLDRHGGLEGYIQAKELIFKNSTTSDVVALGVDDDYTARLFESLDLNAVPLSTRTFQEHGVYVEGTHLVDAQSGTPEVVCDLSHYRSLKGEHNWQNAIAAYTLARAVGVETSQIIAAFETFPGLAHRQQVIKMDDNVVYVNDSKATNADAVSKALVCYQGDTIYWLAGGRSKEGGIASLTSLFPHVHHAFLYGEAQDTFALTLDKHLSYTKCGDLKTAVAKATSMAKAERLENPVVLLSPACASFDQFKDFEARGDAFCDYVDYVTSLKGAHG